VDQKIKNDLVDIVGADNFSDALIDLVSYSYDFSEHRSRPDCAVWPASTEQVSAIVALANRERIAVVPRGAGTGATGMAVPRSGGLILDFARMNGILRISVEDHLTVVQPGVIYADLQKALGAYGFFFPPDPASGKVCTLGGNVATNAGGLKGAKYGTTRNYVLGLEVVFPDGRIARVGSHGLKSVSGFNLAHILVGSEGTLGVLTEITLRIAPKPGGFATALASFAELRQAGDAVSRIIRSGVIPSACELLDRHIVDLLIEQAGLSLPRAAAMILVETDGLTQVEADRQMEKVVEILQKNNAREIRRAASARETELLWKGRRSLGSVIASAAPNFLVEDVTVPISRLTDLLEGVERIAAAHGVEMVNFGHAGDGNLHPHILYDGSDPAQVEKVAKVTAELFRLTLTLGGTLSGEHGIGLSKAPFMGLEHDPVAMDFMRSLKRMFDPRNILNPGKMGLDD